MNGFSYDRSNGTSQKKEQFALNKFADSIQKKMLYKILGFLDRV